MDRSTFQAVAVASICGALSSLATVYVLRWATADHDRTIFTRRAPGSGSPLPDDGSKSAKATHHGTRNPHQIVAVVPRHAEVAAVPCGFSAGCGGGCACTSTVTPPRRLDPYDPSPRDG